MLDVEGILVRVHVKGQRAQVVIPDSLKSAVLHWVHGSVAVGHWGMRSGYPNPKLRWYRPKKCTDQNGTHGIRTRDLSTGATGALSIELIPPFHRLNFAEHEEASDRQAG
jgi:hypothetical protein